MEAIYPLNPVVTDDPAFAQKYNDDFMSAYYLSECISFDEAKDLISSEASFSRVVFLDKESTFVEEFKRQYLQATSLTPELIGISKSNSVDETVQKVHNEVREIRKGTG